MELDTLKVDQFKGLKNVVVTLSPTGNKEIKMVGLFGGIMPITKTDSVLVSKEDVYICLIKGTTVHFLSSLFYYVAYIEIAGLNAGTSPVTLMTPYNETNCKNAVAVLHKIHDAMREEKRVTEFDMIDDEKYTGLTEVQKREINFDGPANTASKQPFNRSGSQNLGSEDGGWNGWYGHASRGHNPNACGYSSTTTYAKKVTTATFSRTKKAEQTELDEMAAKIKAIQEGTYTPPALPTIPADKVKEKKEDEKKVTTTTDTSQESSSAHSSDDYDEGNIYMCG